MSKGGVFWCIVKCQYFPKGQSLGVTNRTLFANPYQAIPRCQVIDKIIRMVQTRGL